MNPTEPTTEPTMEIVTAGASALRSGVRALESATQLDTAVEALRPTAERLSEGEAGRLLGGSWLGHAVHPLLTDIPLGCWASAGLLDLVGGRRSRKAAQRLVGIGVLASVPTVATGLSDWGRLRDVRAQRVGVAHAAGNAVVFWFYAKSWLARRRGNHARGILLGLAGGVLAVATGYLGGHLSYGRAAGVGERWEDGPSTPGTD